MSKYSDWVHRPEADWWAPDGSRVDRKWRKHVCSGTKTEVDEMNGRIFKTYRCSTCGDRI
jgi:hypothetical protein